MTATMILIGRGILGAFFVIAGIRNFLRFSERKSMETNYGWKLPVPLTAIGFATQLIGGLAVMLGLWPALGAIALILFLIAATALFHNFLRFQGNERDPHLYFALVNTALCGAFLLVIAISV